LKENMPETLLSITMQLVCKIKSEIIIIIIIIDTIQSATTVKPMEIKKALLLLYKCYSYEGLKKSGRAIKSKIRGFCICILTKKR
jgi:hypothetical protein